MNKHTLFHFSDIDSIKLILKDMGFKASYCKETITNSNYITKGGIQHDYSIPVVSFTDLTSTSILNYKSTYGNCAIGMNIEWGKKEGLNPVLYLEKNSKISQSIAVILSHLKKPGIPKSLDSAATTLMQSIKNYEGSHKNQPFNHYEEQEWRFIAITEENKTYPPYVYTDTEGCDKLKSFNSKPHLKENEFLLKFEVDDIDCIIIDYEIRKALIIDYFKKDGLFQLIDKVKII